MKNNNKPLLWKAYIFGFALIFANSINAQRSFITLDNCDNEADWFGLSSISVNAIDQKEGAGCLETTGSTNEQKFRKAFATPIDVTKNGEIEISDAVLKFWLYVSDVSYLSDQGGQIEFGSNGGPDQNEWNWSFGKAQIKAGWNEYTLDLNNHGGTGGSPDPTKMNWFRMYFFTNASSTNVVYRLDNIRVESKTLVKIGSYSVALNEQKKATISWNSLKESASGFYTIEHSANGKNFTALTQIQGKEGSYPRSYEFTDERSLEGINYYRLVYESLNDSSILGNKYVILQGGNKANSILGKVIAGYQGWFNCAGDGSPVARWHHWGGNPPSRGNLSFEVYPDVSEYKTTDLFQSGFASFGNGNKAKLFSSYKSTVIDKHFEWMKTYEIDGAALQRFLGELSNDPVFKRNRDSIAVRMSRAAQKYDRIFYIMYDMGAVDRDTVDFKKDWTHLVKDLKITDSPAYAHQDGKPVVCIWGFGFTSREDQPVNSMKIINWLKEQGCYIIGGVPTNWRTGNGDSWADYAEVYKSFDMISPWMVGRLASMKSIDDHRTNTMLPDLEYCQANGIAYQPVTYPGFGWSQWNPGNPNLHPRAKGEFFWKQVNSVQMSGIPNLYLAMFDEYDEGTAFIKNASDWSEIPTDQYFMTASTDGYWLSSDFQLRMARAASRVMKGIDAPTTEVTVPHSLGPVYYRNSFEKRTTPYDYQEVNGVKTPQKTGTFNLDPCFLNPVQISKNGVTDAATTNIANNLAKSGLYLAKITGNASGENANYYYKFGEAKIVVKEGMKLSFAKYTVNELGLNTNVSLQFSDGTFLHTQTLTDNANIGVNPKYARGIISEWTEHSIVIGQGALIGKTITGLMLGYEGNATGSFEAYFDNLLIQDGDNGTAIPNVPNRSSDKVGIYPTNITDGSLYINTMNTTDNMPLSVSITNMKGYMVMQKVIAAKTIQVVSLNLNPGIYIASVTGNGIHATKKIVVE